MLTVQLDELELIEGWVEGKPTWRGRFDFPITAANGAASSSVIYFEVDPGDHILRHIHSAEEILLVLDGEGEAEVGGERGRVRAGGMVLVPSLVPHSIDNVGNTTLRVVGFFSSAAMVHTYVAPISPFDTRVLVTPPPDDPDILGPIAETAAAADA